MAGINVQGGGSDGKKDYKDFNLEKLDIDAFLDKTEIVVKSEDNAALITPQEGNAFVLQVAKEFDIEPPVAFVAIGLIYQKGGTSKRAQGNIYVIVGDNVKVDLSMLRAVEKKMGVKWTPRQYARTYATPIYKMARRFQVPGDLHKKILRKYPHLNFDDQCWLSNFQMDNEDCPLILREYIMEHFKDLFPNSTKMIG